MKRSRISALFVLIFGKLNWSSPPWVNYFRGQAKTRPWLFVSTLISILALLLVLSYAYCWYQKLPKPIYTAVTVIAPGITQIKEKEEPVPDVLTLTFDKAVAPLANIGQDVTNGVQISPKVTGTWHWEDDKKLIFTPTHDWQANQAYQINFAKSFFSSHADLENFSYSFATQPFAAEIKDLSLYQNPIDAKDRKAVATVSFNFPVNPKSFEEKVMLNNVHNANGTMENNELKNYPLTITYDKYNRTAYLHSQELTLPKIAEYLVLTIPEGIQAETGSAKTERTRSQTVFIPDSKSYFRISNVNSSIIRNEQDKAEQILNIETSIGTTEESLNKYLEVYALPTNYPAIGTVKEKPNYEWLNPGEVTAPILALATKVSLNTLPSEYNFSSLHSFQFNIETPHYLYIKIKKGVQGFGDFTLTEDYNAVIKAPEFPKEISFLHKGSLLALSDEEKLSVLVRGLEAVKFTFARVRPTDVNQLITQTQGDMSNPYFINQSFNEQNVSEIFSEIQSFNSTSLSKQQYTALDFGKYLARVSNNTLPISGNPSSQAPRDDVRRGPHGLFLLQAIGWNKADNTALDVKATRLVLITDMGMIVKDNQDGTHDVFVESIREGTPLAGVQVAILGKNGLPILTQTTNNEGRVSFPELKSYIDDREPVVYLASLGEDSSFIPYNNPGRNLNFSRYDVGGVYNNRDQHSLSAYLFSDRGIYRPGDSVHLGMIVKQTFAAPQPAGLTLQATITDPRGTTVIDNKFVLNSVGFSDLDFKTNEASPTGQYQVSLYIVKDNYPDSLLGSTTFRVNEFLPDRMRIQANLSEPTNLGWISPHNLTANIVLSNLYGAPAANRRVSAKILLEPKNISFAKYPDYIFADPLLDPKKPTKVFTDNLADSKTDAEGKVNFSLNLDRFSAATYQLTFFAEGFEADSGRSVTTQTSALVSPLSYFIGYKANGDVNYIKQNTERLVHFIAVNPKLEMQALDKLKIQYLTLKPVFTLVKKPNGTYEYQSIIQTKISKTENFSIPKEGYKLALPTDQIGEFAVQLLDKDNTVLSYVNYNVVGTGQITLNKNAELTLKLNKESYEPGEDIEVNITAPYTGSGLITIERDKVYATTWFKTDTTSSIQKITVPKDFQGNGYVNVAFMRDWNSSELFMSPLSYSVVPFAVPHDKQTLKIELNSPEKAEPGHDFPIAYSSDKPGKIIIFAVDEGILQVARYITPDPLAFFFQKRALEVITQQTVDLILPKFIKDRELSSVGGDGGGKFLLGNLNPFKRKTDLPVVFWSGIIDTDQTTRKLTYPIPDYFNGSLRVMAVGVSLDTVGSAEKTAIISGPFVISPNLPVVVAPNDQFEMTATIANNVKGSGHAAPIKLNLEVEPGLEIIGAKSQTIAIDEGKEKTVHYQLRANSILGSAAIRLTAALEAPSHCEPIAASQASRNDGEEKQSSVDCHVANTPRNDEAVISSMQQSLSVRPASPLLTTINSGMSKDSTKTINLTRVLYPEFRKVEAMISTSPLILVSGLQRYLEHFPYGCTEQLTSEAFPLLAMTQSPSLLSDKQKINEQLFRTVQMLSSRQMTDGGFSYWPGTWSNQANKFASIYAMHFLTDAKDQGYNIPTGLFNMGLDYLKNIANQNLVTDEDARNTAYAIYVLTRNEILTTNYISHLQLYLDKVQKNQWQHSLTGAYIAATYQLLKNDTMGFDLISQYQIPQASKNTEQFYDANIANAQYFYLIARHFPQYLNKIHNKFIPELVSAINNEDINSLTASYTSIALLAYTEAVKPTNDSELTITETLDNGNEKSIVNTVSQNAKKITLHNPDNKNFFYQLTVTGFDKNPDNNKFSHGIEIAAFYRNSDGKDVETIAVGDEIEVHIQARSVSQPYLNNVAIVSLLPGGFEIVRESVKTGNMDYADMREDRVIFFGTLTDDTSEIVYKIKATNVGQYTVPPVLAESMYNPQVKGQSGNGGISVLGTKI